MKRSQMPPRRARLAPGTPPERRTGLQRGAPLPSVPRQRADLPDGPPKVRPKPARPTVSREEKHSKGVVRERSGGVCEGCGHERGLDFSHRVAEGQGGPWCPANGLHLCRRCHRWGHAEPIAAEQRGWLLPSHRDFLVVPAQHWLYGWVRLTPDGMYVPTTDRP